MMASLRDPIAEIIAACTALRSEERRVFREEDRARNLTAEAQLLPLVSTRYFGLAGADVGFDLLGLVRAPGEVRAGGYNQSLSDGNNFHRRSGRRRCRQYRKGTRVWLRKLRSQNVVWVRGVWVTPRVGTLFAS
jgi:hypothetical protein